MEKKISKLSSLALIALLTISAVVFLAPSAKAQTTTLEVIANEGLAVGSHDSNFTTDQKSLSDTFWVNITVFDITDLQNWQIKLTWDSSLLSYVSISRPSDHVFSGAGHYVDSEWVPYDMVSPPVDTGPGYVIWGCTFVNGARGTPDYWTFNGTGRLCQVRLRIIKDVGQPPSTPLVSCDLALVDKGINTFLLNGDVPAHDIVFDIVNGRYFYWWLQPTFYPILWLKPAVCKPLAIGDKFALEVWVKNVSAAWEIIGFQFSLMWDTKFIEPAAPFYDNGTFLEAFEYNPDGVLYSADINDHNRPPPLTPIPDNYNYSMFGAILLPDTVINPYHAPFPSVGEGGALLMTVYFRAIYDTLSPIEDWTWIEFIQFKVDEDTFALNRYIRTVAASGIPCHYRAPQRILGLAIDLYTQYAPPFGGQGPHNPSDMFGPQQLVDLFALVTYNEYPVQQKLVGFHIIHNGYDIYREDATDENGVAHVSFRLPWPCVDPVEEIFGKWYVIATVEVAEDVKNDTLGFLVWWPVEVLSVEPKSTEYIHNKQGEPNMEFVVEYRTFSMQELDVTLTVTVYDELSFFIGSDYLETTVGLGDYVYYDYMACEWPPESAYTWETTIPLPSNAVVGKATVFANAFDKFPWDGGTPYCPEVKNTIDFYIKKP